VSRHHRAQKWSTHSPKLRALIQPQLPLPCARCGKPVMPTDKWHVGHIQDAEHGGAPVYSNVRPEHARCSNRSGGKRAAQIVNARRRNQSNTSKGIRDL